MAEVVIGKEDPILGLPWGNGISVNELEKFDLDTVNYSGNFARFFGCLYLGNLTIKGDDLSCLENLAILVNKIESKGYDIRFSHPDSRLKKALRKLGFKVVPDIASAPSGHKVFGHSAEEPLKKYQRLIAEYNL